MSRPLFGPSGAFAPPSQSAASVPTGRWRPGGLPLFWRLVGVNVVVVFGGAFLATLLAQQLQFGGAITPVTHSLVVIVAIVVAAGLTMRQIQSALRPIHSLQEVIDRFNAGDRSARAVVDSAADPTVAAVVLEMNALWDRLETDAQTIQQKTEQAERLAAQVISAQEDERRRVARELHDEAGQALTALVIGLERGLAAMPEAYAPGLPVQPRQMVADLRDLAADTLDEVRKIALELRPSVLDDLGLVAALRDYARSTEERTGLRVRVSASGLGDDGRLPPSVENALFRIAQEAVTNVVRHAEAQTVSVRLSRTPDEVALDVRDDGLGMPSPVERDQAQHLGLFGMRERAHLLGGTVRVGPVAPHGTLVSAHIPVHRDDRP